MRYTLLRETKPKARKEHTCIWCGESIEIGETYRYEKSVFDGDIQNRKWHLECVADSEGFFSETGEEFDPYEADRPPERMGFSLSNDPGHRLVRKPRCEGSCEAYGKCLGEVRLYNVLWANERRVSQTWYCANGAILTQEMGYKISLANA